MGQQNPSASSSGAKIDAIIVRLRGTLTEDEIKTLQKCIEIEQLNDVESSDLDEKRLILLVEILLKIFTGFESINDIFKSLNH